MNLSLEEAVRYLGFLVVGAPTLLVAAAGLTSLFDRPFSERTMGRWVLGTVAVGLLAAVTILTLMLVNDRRHIPVNMGDWVTIEHDEHTHFNFSIIFVFDRLSVPFAILSFVLCGTIGKFGIRYMHRERGFNRFFTLYSVFMMGMIVTSLAGSIETLFAGWELVGLSSAFLVAYYHERSSPVRNGLRIWSLYRVSDAALLLASIVLHHMQGHGDFALLFGLQSWPDQTLVAGLNPNLTFLVGILLLIAAAVKSALVPFSNWLPRAMEGPTPSSAVFYGALSVHLGAFLLLRISPLLDSSPTLCVIIVVIGVLTAVFSAFVGRVQTDIKSALSYASITQVGIIVAEIGCGLRYIALIHILGHACLRTLQFLRAPTLLHDYRLMENALGERMAPRPLRSERLLSERTKAWFYRYALQRGYLDALLTDYVVGSFLSVFRFFDRLERRWTDFLTGGQSREMETQPVHVAAAEETV